MTPQRGGSLEPRARRIARAASECPRSPMERSLSRVGFATNATTDRTRTHAAETHDTRVFIVLTRASRGLLGWLAAC